VGNGKVDVDQTGAREPGLTGARPRVCTAMAQQCGDSGRGNQSAPQKLVHLVGCRDPKARPDPVPARRLIQRRSVHIPVIE
jgi:hypothetical protein